MVTKTCLSRSKECEKKCATRKEKKKESEEGDFLMASICTFVVVDFFFLLLLLFQRFFLSKWPTTHQVRLTEQLIRVVHEEAFNSNRMNISTKNNLMSTTDQRLDKVSVEITDQWRDQVLAGITDQLLDKVLAVRTDELNISSHRIDILMKKDRISMNGQ